MANTQINVTANGTTTLATAGKYCDRNIDVNVNVSGGGVQPTQFTNLYDPSRVVVGKRTTSTLGSYADDSECNYIRIPFHHVEGEPFAMRVRGIGTIRSRLHFFCFDEDGETAVTSGTLNAYIDLSYDEYGDAVLTGKGTPFASREWYFIEFNFQYPSLSSATTAITGPIITINEPIGNGGYVG